jgi:SAM-dependent methyltransferase
MTETYYNSLAPYYKSIYPDWDQSVQRQAEALDGVIREFVGETSKTVLDAACGIGTQSIGLAKIGYKVTASDLSSAAIQQARREAERYGVQLSFKSWICVGLKPIKGNSTQSCFDNAVPPVDDTNLTAFRQFRKCTRSGGVVSSLNYANLERRGKRSKSISVSSPYR